MKELRARVRAFLGPERPSPFFADLYVSNRSPQPLSCCLNISPGEAGPVISLKPLPAGCDGSLPELFGAILEEFSEVYLVTASPKFLLSPYPFLSPSDFLVGGGYSVALTPCDSRV